MKKQRLSLMAYLLLTCCLVMFLGKPATSLAQAPDKEKDGSKILNVGVGIELNALYPLNDSTNYMGTKLCYESLIYFEDGKFVPGLAESWEFSEDGKSLTFHLRENISFHDGSSFNTEAVKANYEYAKSNPNFARIKAISNCERMELVDDRTIIFHYPNPYFAYLNDFCYPDLMALVSPAVIEEGNFLSMKDVVGTGPYIYKENAEGEYVRFIRNEDYWGDRPYYDEIIMKYIPESSSRLQALKTGEIDLIFSSELLSWDDYEQALSIDGVAGKVSETDSETRNLVLNAGSPSLSDVRVRKAIAYAIDKEAIVNGLSKGNEKAAYRLFSPGVKYTDFDLDTTYIFDQEKAAKLLDEAGWAINTKTGIREKEGRSLSLSYTYYAAGAMNSLIASTIKSQLADVGIDVKTEAQDMMTWWQNCTMGNYDITQWDTETAFASPHNYFTNYAISMPQAPYISSLEGAQDFLDLISEFQTTGDESRVAEIFEQILNYVNDNVLDLPISYVKEMVVYRTGAIADFEFSGVPTHFDPILITPAE